MVFRADTYYRNKYRALAWKDLNEARVMKQAGAPPERIAAAVKMARGWMHLAVIYENDRRLRVYGKLVVRR